MVFYNSVHFGNMEQRVTKDPRHVFIYFHNKFLGVPRSDGCKIVGGAEAEESGFIHYGNGGYRDIQFHFLPDEPGYLMQV